MQDIIIDGCSLSIPSLVAVARRKASVRLDPDAVARMHESHEVVDYAVKKRHVKYGITTGFGKFCNVIISEEDNALLQKNLIMSHACGQGEPFAPEIVRAMMVLRANALAVGNSGVRPVVVERILQLINRNVVPVVPEKGSLGASGDLAPLAHIALVLIGMGEAFYHGMRMPGAQALAEANIPPLVLGPKEGLALINGTQAMARSGLWQSMMHSCFTEVLPVQPL